MVTTHINKSLKHVPNNLRQILVNLLKVSEIQCVLQNRHPYFFFPLLFLPFPPPPLSLSLAAPLATRFLQSCLTAYRIFCLAADYLCCIPQTRNYFSLCLSFLTLVGAWHETPSAAARYYSNLCLRSLGQPFSPSVASRTAATIFQRLLSLACPAPCPADQKLKKQKSEQPSPGHCASSFPLPTPLIPTRPLKANELNLLGVCQPH